MADSIALFGEGSAEEQFQELAEFGTRGLPDDRKEAFLKEFASSTENSADRKQSLSRLIIDGVKDFNIGSERETEGFFNLLFAQSIQAFPDPQEQTELFKPILASISSSSSENITLKYRILANLFNALPKSSPARPSIYLELLSLSSKNNDVSLLKLSRVSVEQWLSEWNISPEEKSAFLKTLSGHLDAGGKRASSYPSQDPKAAVLDAVASSLRLPVAYDISAVLTLKTLSAIDGHPLRQLLDIVANEGASEWGQWSAQNQATLDEFGLQKNELEKKVRFLALSSLACQHVGGVVTFKEIAEGLNVPESDVESWIIEALQAKLISAKISQPTRQVFIARSTTRSVGKKEWETLGEHLQQWRSGLLGVLDVVKTAAAAQTRGPDGGAREGGESRIESSTVPEPVAASV